MNDLEFYIQLGGHIKQLRKKRGFSLLEFAHRCEIEKASLTRIESGRTNPTTKTLRIIANQLEVHVRDLFEFELRK
ncbi:MAG: helix-turn-helix transcriptional regulator [Salibacteraceae bacterium]